MERKRKNDRNVSFRLDVTEDYEFLPQVPEQFFVRAMNSGVPVYLTEDLLARVSRVNPDELVDRIIDDLHKSNEETDPLLRWFYLMMDFQDDFPRLMQMLAQRDDKKPYIGS